MNTPASTAEPSPRSCGEAVRHCWPAMPKTGPPTTAQAVQKATSEPVVPIPRRWATR